MTEIFPAEQLDLFADAPAPLIALAPCGRGRGPCLAYYEPGPSAPQLHCVSCDCIVPVPRTVTDHPRDPFKAIIEGYRLAQLRNSCSEQDIAPDNATDGGGRG